MPATVQQLLDRIHEERHKINEQFVEACRKVGYDMVVAARADTICAKRLHQQLDDLANLYSFIQTKCREYVLDVNGSDDANR